MLWLVVCEAMKRFIYNELPSAYFLKFKSTFLLFFDSETKLVVSNDTFILHNAISFCSPKKKHHSISSTLLRTMRATPSTATCSQKPQPMDVSSEGSTAQTDTERSQ